MKEEILKLRREGLLVTEISAILNISVTQICNVIREQNDRDKEDDRSAQ